MKPLAVVGPSDADTRALVEQLAERLAERGRVGTVTGTSRESPTGRVEDVAHDNPPGVSRAYHVADGRWAATGDSLSLSDALGRLACTCDYGLVADWPESRLPAVQVGEHPQSGDESGDSVVHRAPTVDDVDRSAVVEAVETVEPYETLESLVDRVKDSPRSDRAGAIATFTGRVRPKDSPDDDRTEFLEFEKYDGVADRRMTELRETLEDRDGVYEVRLHHRTGVVEAEEDIVFVVVLAGHRSEAFRTVQDGINRLKEEVPLFKKEVTVGDEFWAHEH